MAEAIISAIIGDLVSRVISLLIRHYKHHQQQQQSTETKLQSIRHKLIRIHSVVEEARGRQITNDGALQWLSELIDAEHQGKYLLEVVKDVELEFEGEQDDSSTVPSQVSTFSLSNPAKRVRVAACHAVIKRKLSRRRHDDLVVAGEIDGVLEKLQGVCGDLREFIMLLQSYQPIHPPLRTNIFRDGQMFGRHVEKERIINFLLQQEQQDSEIGVLPVVGDTGAGKTTLVQHVCDDARVRGHFQMILLLNFSCASAIVGSGREATFVLHSRHVVGDAGTIDVGDPHQLASSWDLGGRRFLMVFEDVDTRKKLQVLQELLPRLRSGGGQGSKIIVTANNRRVASIGTTKPMVLNVLPFPEYWFFFKAHAFAGRDLEESPRLVAEGKAIAEKLDGSFFGAKIAGAVLRNNPDPCFWCRVSSSNIGDMSLLGDGINCIVDLSQKLLPRNVCMNQVVVSKDQFSQTELARLRGVSTAEIYRLAQDNGYARVLLCRSVLPFYTLYYTARCTARAANSCSKVSLVQ